MLVKVANKSDIPPGQGKIIVANGKEIAIFNVEGKFHAIADRCPHKEWSLGKDGVLEGNIVTCSGHGWMFDVETGKAVAMPVSVQKYKVKVEGEDILVEV